MKRQQIFAIVMKIFARNASARQFVDRTCEMCDARKPCIQASSRAALIISAGAYHARCARKNIFAQSVRAA
jgi:hypothetical protein